MSDLKDKLIKIGSKSPDLQKHIRPVLDRISQTKTSGLSEDIAQKINRSVREALGREFDVSMHRRPTRDGLEFEIEKIDDPGMTSSEYVLTLHRSGESRTGEMTFSGSLLSVKGPSIHEFEDVEASSIGREIAFHL